MNARPSTLPYLPAMFGACMVFQTLYIACLALWALYPAFGAHEMLEAVFPQFELLTPASFIYGFVASAIYGWIVAGVFVFFYNLWIGIAGALGAKRRAPA